MLPIRDIVPSRDPPLATCAPTLANGVVFLFETTMPPPELERFFHFFGIVPARLAHPDWAVRVGKKSPSDLDLPEKADELARLLSEGTWTLDRPIAFEKARDFGLPVRRQPTAAYLPEPRRFRGDREARG